VINWEAEHARCPQGPRWRLSAPTGMPLGQRGPAPAHGPAASPPRGDSARATAARDGRMQSPVGAPRCPSGAIPRSRGTSGAPAPCGSFFTAPLQHFYRTFMTLCGIYWYPPQCLVARVGLASSLSPGIRRFALRASRSSGLARPPLQPRRKATAVHGVRVSAWCWGEPCDERRRQQRPWAPAACSGLSGAG